MRLKRQGKETPPTQPTPQSSWSHPGVILKLFQLLKIVRLQVEVDWTLEVASIWVFGSHILWIWHVFCQPTLIYPLCIVTILHLFLNTHTYIYIHTYIICIYICIYIYINIYIDIYTYIYTHLFCFRYLQWFARDLSARNTRRMRGPVERTTCCGFSKVRPLGSTATAIWKNHGCPQRVQNAMFFRCVPCWEKQLVI